MMITTGTPKFWGLGAISTISPEPMPTSTHEQALLWVRDWRLSALPTS